MSLQTIIDNAVSIEFIRNKLVGQTVSRSGLVKIAQVANNVPWRMIIDPRPGMRFEDYRYLTEEIDRMDRVVIETINIGNSNPKLAYLTAYKGALGNTDLANITAVSAANLAITLDVSSVTADANTTVFSAGDFIQLENNRYPYTVTANVLRGSNSTINVAINRPFIEQANYTVANANIVVGSNITWQMVMSRKPSYRVVPGGYLEWSDVFEIVEVIDIPISVAPSPPPPPPPPPPPDPMANVVVLHGFGAPGASTEVSANQFWRIDESGNNNDIIATGTSGDRYYDSNDATFVDDGNIGTIASNVLYGSGTFARLSTGTASFANIAHSDDFIFTGPFTVECWARHRADAVNRGGLISKWGRNGEGNSWIMYMKANEVVEALLSLDGTNTALTLTGNVTRTANTWQHYALERNDEDVVRLYLDGAVIAEGNLSGNLYNNNTSPLYYGAGTVALTDVNSGWRIDECRITNGTAQYNGAFTVPTQPHARANATNVSVSTTNNFIATAEANGTLTTANVSYTATGGDGTGTTYGYIYTHTLALGATTGPVLTLSNNIGSPISVSANGNVGDSAVGTVTTLAQDPTGFRTSTVRQVSLSWLNVSLDSSYTISDAQFGDQSIAQFKLSNAGDVIETTQTLGEIDVGDWITPKSLANSSYEVRATLTSAPTGSAQFQGTTGSWLSLGSDRTWSLIQSIGGGYSEVSFFVEIRLGSTVLANSNVFMNVDSSS